MIVDGLEALVDAGRRLQRDNPKAFAKLVAAARAFVAVLDRPTEPREVFVSRLAEIGPSRSKATN